MGRGCGSLADPKTSGPESSDEGEPEVDTLRTQTRPNARSPRRSAAPTEEGNPPPASPGESSPRVVDATGLVLGRASSLIAKRLLNGERIVVVNAEKAVVVGRREDILRHFQERRARGSVRKGPFYPRQPDRIFRRSVRGMLPFHKSRGRDAFGRVMAYIGVPEEFAKAPRETLEDAKVRPSLRPPLTLADISKLLGVP